MLLRAWWHDATDQTQTVVVKRWFGDNGAADENGDPCFVMAAQFFSQIVNNGRWQRHFAREGAPSGYGKRSMCSTLTSSVLELS